MLLVGVLTTLHTLHCTRLCDEGKHVNVDVLVSETCQLLGVSSLRDLGLDFRAARFYGWQGRGQQQQQQGPRPDAVYLSEFLDREKRVQAGIAAFIETRWVRGAVGCLLGLLYVQLLGELMVGRWG